MQFGTSPVESAAGAILGHSVRAGTAVFRKGRLVSQADVAVMREAGLREIVVARLDAGDMPEDEAAARIAAACAGDFVRVGAAFTGRANVYSDGAGLALVDRALVDAVNGVDESITLATVAPFARVTARQILATVKIVPFAAPRRHIHAIEHLLRARQALRVAPFAEHRAALISTMLPGDRPSLLDKNRASLEERLAAIGSRIVFERRVAHETNAVAEAIREADGADPILIFGASAIADRRDIIPAAIEMAGGTVEAFGMPVDPGNLLLTARLGGTTVVGLPSCARSPKLNGVDFVMWRIAAGLPVGRAEVLAMGVGGLLNEIPTRPQPRDERPAEVPHMPRIAAIVLAAGQSSRMGVNKLLADVGGKPLVRHAVDAAVTSAADPVIVVTGNSAGQVEAALSGSSVRFANNQDFPKGLSASLGVALASCQTTVTVP
jgi:molybdenum cofactor cytidylyltransferase